MLKFLIALLLIILFTSVGGYHSGYAGAGIGGGASLVLILLLLLLYRK